MKLIVLCDNNTFIDNYLLGEPALSFYLNNDGDELLFDLGYSDVFCKNAEKLGINISNIKKIVFSHGHNDHTNGIKFVNGKKTVFYVNGCFDKKYDSNKLSISSPFDENEMKERFDLKSTNSCTEISKNLYFLGKIPRVTAFETSNQNLKTETTNGFVVDEMKDDSALVFDGKNGISIITGCSHSGICNIIQYAKNLFNKKVKLIIGGFHLFDINDQTKNTIEFLKNENIDVLYPCHCTSLQVKCEMKLNGLNIQEVGSGLSIEIN